MIIQIIGSPGAGKTYAIRKYLKNRKKCTYLDIANYRSNYRTRYYKMKKDIIRKKGHVIVESACGLDIQDTVVIRYKKNETIVCKNLLKRDGEADMDYISLLNANSIKPNYTVTEMNTLHKLLDRLLFAK